MYSLLGWFNAIALVLLTAAWWFPRLNRSVLKLKASTAGPLNKSLRRLHKPLGLALAVAAPIHGYLALGSFRLHTGSLLYISVLLTASAGGAFYKTRNKAIFKVHKALAFLTVLLLLLHLLAPGALFALLN